MTIAEYQAFQDELVDQALAGIYFMLLFAVVVAVVGVANTIALSVSERVQEIGMLRAIGLPREHVSRMVRIEAGLTSIAGGLMGVVIGLYLGTSLAHDAGVGRLRAAVDPAGRDHRVLRARGRRRGAVRLAAGQARGPAEHHRVHPRVTSGARAAVGWQG